MTDAFAIQQVINRYGEASSRRDFAAVVATFAEDGRWELPDFGMAFAGREALREVMPGFLAPYEHFQQINAPAVIEIDGEGATARSVIREYCKFRDRDVANEIYGAYHDDLVRRSGEWLFARRRFVLLGGHSYETRPLEFALPDG